MILNTWTLNCRYDRVRIYIDITLIMACCDIARVRRIPAHRFSSNEELRYRIFYEVHDTAISGHLGCEKTYGLVSQRYWWLKLYKWISTYVRTYETCERVKLSVMRLRHWQVFLYLLDVGSPSAWILCLAYRRTRMATRVL